MCVLQTLDFLSLWLRVLKILNHPYIIHLKDLLSNVVLQVIVRSLFIEVLCMLWICKL